MNFVHENKNKTQAEKEAPLIEIEPNIELMHLWSSVHNSFLSF